MNLRLIRYILILGINALLMLYVLLLISCSDAFRNKPENYTLFCKDDTNLEDCLYLLSFYQEADSIQYLPEYCQDSFKLSFTNSDSANEITENLGSREKMNIIQAWLWLSIIFDIFLCGWRTLATIYKKKCRFVRIFGFKYLVGWWWFHIIQSIRASFLINYTSIFMKYGECTSPGFEMNRSGGTDFGIILGILIILNIPLLLMVIFRKMMVYKKWLRYLIFIYEVVATITFLSLTLVGISWGMNSNYVKQKNGMSAASVMLFLTIAEIVLAGFYILRDNISTVKSKGIMMWILKVRTTEK